jgi:hypothetical protein
MKTLTSALLALVSFSLALPSALAQSDQQPPTAVIVEDDFSPTQSQWQPASGTWTVANGTYGNASTAANEITTITRYRGVHPADPGEPVVRFDDFTVSARMRNTGTTDAHLVGLVYGYQDSQNYYEVLVSATGTLRRRIVMNGVAVDEVPAGRVDIPRDTWFELKVHWRHGVASLQVNGIRLTSDLSQSEFTSGQIGLITHGAVGRFDKVFLGVPFGDREFLEDFEQGDEEPFVEFSPQSGQWSIVNGTYQNSAVQQTNVSLAPVNVGGFPNQGDTMEYTFRARMLNPYGGPGNLIGVVLNYKGVNYTEVVFSPTGVVKLNRVDNNRVRTIATASYGGGRNVAFEVSVENGPDHFAVVANGQRFFEDVNLLDVNPLEVPDGAFGLITHWAPGRFDNLEFRRGFFRPCSFKFDQPPSPSQIVSGTWNVNGGTLNNTSVNATDIVTLPCGSGIYSARLRNEYGAAGNLVGLIYDYQAFGLYAGDYYEVTFSPTGRVRMNKIIQGVRYQVRTGAYNVPPNTWFNVQVIRRGTRITITINGTAFVEGLLQGELRGRAGVVSHWSKGHFDDMTVTEFISSPPSQL